MTEPGVTLCGSRKCCIIHSGSAAQADVVQGRADLAALAVDGVAADAAFWIGTSAALRATLGRTFMEE